MSAAAPLVWRDDRDSTEPLRFSFQSERVRGEPTYYELWFHRPEDVAYAVEHDLELGFFDKRKLKRAAQRIANAVEPTAEPPSKTPLDVR